MLFHRQQHVLFHLFLKPVCWTDKTKLLVRQEKEGGEDWQECNPGYSLQVCTGSMLQVSTKTTDMDIHISISLYLLSSCCSLDEGVLSLL